MTNIFLSRPTFIPEQFKLGIDNFLKILNNLKLTPRTIGVSDYPNDSPLDEVIRLLKDCKGSIVLGLPQLIVTNGILKEIPLNSTLALATEWNHIEASLAYAKDLPLLIIHDQSVTRGVFDHGAVGKFIYSVDMTRSDWVLSDSIQGAIKTWISRFDSKKEDQISNTLKKEKICPNCSTSQKTIYLSPIPSDFVGIENANFECTKCGYKVMM